MKMLPPQKPQKRKHELKLKQKLPLRPRLKPQHRHRQKLRQPPLQLQAKKNQRLQPATQNNGLLITRS